MTGKELLEKVTEMNLAAETIMLGLRLQAEATKFLGIQVEKFGELMKEMADEISKEVENE